MPCCAALFTRDLPTNCSPWSIEELFEVLLQNIYPNTSILVALIKRLDSSVRTNPNLLGHRTNNVHVPIDQIRYINHRQHQQLLRHFHWEKHAQRDYCLVRFVAPHLVLYFLPALVEQNSIPWPSVRSFRADIIVRASFGRVLNLAIC